MVLSVNDILRDIERLLTRTLGEHVELVTSLEPELWLVKADPGQLEQVLVNLAVNARDAMPGGGQLVLESHNIDVDEEYVARRPGLTVGRHVRLRVSDTGTGMDRDVVERAFEPFFTTKSRGEGSGLGLATVYGIVKQAGGDVEIYSEPGLGTTISVMLPATEETGGATAKPVKTGPASAGETVLVVEDEAAMRELTRRILDRHGYRVIVAANGAEALRAAEHHEGPIDLLLTDVVMPQMLGKDVAERASAIRPGVRVLYMSGYAQPILGSSGTPRSGSHLAREAVLRVAAAAQGAGSSWTCRSARTRTHESAGLDPRAGPGAGRDPRRGRRRAGPAHPRPDPPGIRVRLPSRLGCARGAPRARAHAA